MTLVKHLMHNNKNMALEFITATQSSDCLRHHFFQEVSGTVSHFVATICPGHHFPAKFVICCNGPTWKMDNAQALLDKAIANCLKLADSKNLKTIAIPSLGSGR